VCVFLGWSGILKLKHKKKLPIINPQFDRVEEEHRSRKRD
jgi:hypothetical protein